MPNNLITAANVSLTLSIASLYTSGVSIQGFATDDAFDFPEVDVTETMMGVDGILSAGWVPVTYTQDIVLQADSDSNTIFEQWQMNQTQQRTPLVAQGTAIIPATGMVYTLKNGFLRAFKLPGAKKVLQPRKYSILWNDVIPSPYIGL